MDGYADDSAAVTTARNTEQAQRKLRRVMLRTKTWLNSHGLDLAMHKTELLLITGRRFPLHVDMNIGNEVIRTKNSDRYLGIRLDLRPATGETVTHDGGCKQHYAIWKRNLYCIGIDNDCIAYRVGISYSVRPSFTCDNRYNLCGSAGGRTDGDL